MVECDLLAANIGSCSDKTSKGFAKVGIIGNTSQMKMTLDIANGLVTDLTKSAVAYEVYQRGNDPFSDLAVTAESKKTGQVFTKEIKVYVRGLNPTSTTTVDKLANGSVYLILQQLGVNDNSKYPILGAESSLMCTAVEWSADEGAFEVTLQEKNGDAPLLFVWKTNENTTDSLVQGLLS